MTISVITDIRLEIYLGSESCSSVWRLWSLGGAIAGKPVKRKPSQICRRYLDISIRWQVEHGIKKMLKVSF